MPEVTRLSGALWVRDVTSGAFVLFGDRAPTDPGAWHPGDPHYDDLTAGDGRLLAEQIAEQLGAVIVTV